VSSAFTLARLPSLETMLRLTAEFGSAMAKTTGEASTGYHRVCNGIGARLFAFREKAADPAGWADARERDAAHVAAWMATLPAAQRTALETNIAEREAEEADDADAGKPWFGGKRDRQEGSKGNFALTRTWKEYRDAVRGAPGVPLRGPPKWDLSKWTAAEKAPFKFDAGGDSD
jgi:hypothetical protein